MADSGTDLSKLGAKDGDGKEKEVEQYVGKLKEIYNKCLNENKTKGE